MESFRPERTFTDAVRNTVKGYKLATALAVGLAGAAVDAPNVQADQEVVVHVGSMEEFEHRCRFALIEMLSTIPDTEVKETWLPAVQSEKLRLNFFRSTEESHGQLAQFSLVREDGKFRPRLDIVGPFLLGATSEKKWSVLLHEFVHYKQWARGFAKDEYFLLNRPIGAATWKEEARLHFEGEIEAIKEEFELLDRIHYTGKEAPGHIDTRYRSWKIDGVRYVVQEVHEKLKKQIKKDQRMLDYLDELEKIYLRKELQK